MPLLDTLSGSHGVGPVCHELNIAYSALFDHGLASKFDHVLAPKFDQDFVSIRSTGMR